MSIDVTWPTSHRVDQLSLRDVTQKTYVDWLIPRQSRDLHHFPPPAILPSENVLGSVTQDEQEMMEGGWRLVGKLDKGQAFVQDYLIFC